MKLFCRKSSSCLWPKEPSNSENEYQRSMLGSSNEVTSRGNIKLSVYRPAMYE
jgi:hypothetical protein